MEGVIIEEATGLDRPVLANSPGVLFAPHLLILLYPRNETAIGRNDSHQLFECQRHPTAKKMRMQQRCASGKDDLGNRLVPRANFCSITYGSDIFAMRRELGTLGTVWYRSQTPVKTDKSSLNAGRNPLKSNDTEMGVLPLFLIRSLARSLIEETQQKLFS